MNAPCTCGHLESTHATSWIGGVKTLACLACHCRSFVDRVVERDEKIAKETIEDAQQPEYL